MLGIIQLDLLKEFAELDLGRWELKNLVCLPGNRRINEYLTDFLALYNVIENRYDSVGLIHKLRGRDLIRVKILVPRAVLHGNEVW